MSLIRPGVDVRLPEASYSFGRDVITIHDATAIEFIERLRGEMLADDAERRLRGIDSDCNICSYRDMPWCPAGLNRLVVALGTPCVDWRPRQ